MFGLANSGLIVVELRKKNNKNGNFATTHFYIELFPARIFGNSKSLAGHKSPERGRLDTLISL